MQNIGKLNTSHLPTNVKNLPSQKFFYFSNLRRIPIHVLCLLGFFAIIGLVNMNSIAVSRGEVYFQKFAFFWVLSVVPFLLMVVVNIRYLVKFSYLIYFLAVFFLVLVLGVGNSTMGAKRWIDFGFLKFQPSELAKIAIIFAMARYYHFEKTFKMHGILNAVYTIFFALVFFILVVKQPDLGSALMILMITLLMIFVNGIQIRWIVIVGMVLALLSPFAWNGLRDYQKNRILTFISPERDPQGAGYNVIQSKIAIGSGGLFGKGYLNNDQSNLKFLPENQTDFAFTVFAEEFGFVGSVFLLVLLGYLVFYGIYVASQSKSYFGKMLAYGISAMFFLHICVNLMMIMGLVPVVGIPLPFISYGGTFLMLCVTSVGVLVNVDVHRNLVIQSTVKTYMFK